ncbi:hypothetical protein M422DRAFT_243475 [Sphaerobolus stellatus SS14]|nr:hypothetical protein M422DRAFT_243475 [Sphaerobolus stellatus SS14]
MNLFLDAQGNKVDCIKMNSTCQGVKLCPLLPQMIAKAPHTKATRVLLAERLRFDAIVRSMSAGPARSLLNKTIAYLNALQKRGCGFPLQEETIFSAAQAEELEAKLQDQLEARRGRELQDQCHGKLLYLIDRSGNPFICCQHYNSLTSKQHFIDYEPSNDQLNTAYMEAFFANDITEMEALDAAAFELGFGPLAPCMTVENFSSQRLSCPADHRDEDGNLTTLQLERTFCESHLLVYIPTEEFLSICPYILLVCVGPHEHPIPIPSKTPPNIKAEVLHMVRLMDLDIADLLPDIENPTLIDLHSSLANKDHLRVYVNQIKSDVFPFGTDWRGIMHYKQLQDEMKHIEEHYVRFIGTFSKVDGSFLGEDTQEECIRLIICMFPESSRRLIQNHYLQSDIAFSRLTNYEEFELGRWDDETRVSVCYCRIFLNCQSAIAHFLVFRNIHRIVMNDTGQGLQWRHLHSETLDKPVGIFSFSVDQHLGQAQGLGLYLQELAQSPELRLKRDLHEPHRFLPDLSEYEHLRRFIRLCINHMKRNIREGNKFEEQVKMMMYSLACIQHPDWEGTLAAIQDQGRKPAIDWVQNKIVCKFAWPGICWKFSFIPLDIWQVGDRHTNLIETLHADVNREGKFCTALSALIRSLRFDKQKLKALTNHEKAGIRVSYKTGLDRERTLHNIHQDQNLRIKLQKKDDIKIQKINGSIDSLSQKVITAKHRLEDVEDPATYPSERRRGSGASLQSLKSALDRAEKAYAKALKSGADLQGRGSGHIPLIPASQNPYPMASGSSVAAQSHNPEWEATHPQQELHPHFYFYEGNWYPYPVQ